MIPGYIRYSHMRENKRAFVNLTTQSKTFVAIQLALNTTDIVRMWFQTHQIVDLRVHLTRKNRRSGRNTKPFQLLVALSRIHLRFHST